MSVETQTSHAVGGGDNARHRAAARAADTGPRPSGLDAVVGDSPLDTAERAFRLLAEGPGALVIDGRVVGVSSPEPVSLMRLRTLVAGRRRGDSVRTRAWQYLVRAAQDQGPAWMVGAVGVALPGLRRVAGRLSARAGRAGWTYYIEDVDAEVLEGFVTRLRVVDPDGVVDVFTDLLNAAYAAGRRAQRSEFQECAMRGGGWPVASMAPPVPVAHPDLVLARAVDRGVISVAEAEVIGATRLEGMLLRQVAAVRNESVDVVKYRRARGERRLVAAIRRQDLSWPA